MQSMKNIYQGFQKYSKKTDLEFCFLMLEKFHFMTKVVFFNKNQLGIGVGWRKLAEIGQKLDFRALFSEIFIKIEVFSSLEHKYTSAAIAQLAARLTFFI